MVSLQMWEAFGNQHTPVHPAHTHSARTTVTPRVVAAPTEATLNLKPRLKYLGVILVGASRPYTP